MSEDKQEYGPGHPGWEIEHGYKRQVASRFLRQEGRSEKVVSKRRTRPELDGRIKISKKEIIVPDIGRITVAGRSKRGRWINPEITPFETAVRSEKNLVATNVTGDFYYVKIIDSAHCLMVVADPVGGSYEAGVSSASGFIGGLRNRLNSVRPLEANHAAEEAIKFADELHQQISQQRKRGSFTFGMLAVSPKEVTQFLMGDAGFCYINGGGFFPKDKDFDGDLMSKLGAFIKQKGKRVFCPNQVGYDQPSSSIIKKIFDRDWFRRKMKKTLMATDFILKDAGFRGGVSPQNRRINIFEQAFNRENPARAALDSMPRSDDAAVICIEWA